MNRSHRPAPGADANGINFEIRDGIRRIRCSVPNEVMDAVSGLPAPLTDGLRRRSFDRFRTVIHGAAMLKLKDLPAGSTGPIVLLRRDLNALAAEGGVRPLNRPAASHALTPVQV
jgi:hypothetical protein